MRWGRLWNEFYKNNDERIFTTSQPPDLHIEDFLNLHSFDPNIKILDSGCGGGKNTQLIYSRFKNTYGVDISEIAIKTEVRNELVIFQRKYANYDKSAYNGIILDGRDIGTVVFPNADFKLFLDADIEIRAERRTQELIHLNYKVIYQDILSELKLRDERDINRSVGPLLKAKDAFFIDTGYKSENLVLQEALEFIKIN